MLSKKDVYMAATRQPGFALEPLDYETTSPLRPQGNSEFSMKSVSQSYYVLFT